MSSRIVFTHIFEDHAERGTLSFDVDAPDDAEIRIDTQDEGRVWISANREGWRHLARVCAELGLGEYAPGHLIRLDFEFKSHEGDAPELLLEVAEERSIA